MQISDHATPILCLPSLIRLQNHLIEAKHTYEKLELLDRVPLVQKELEQKGPVRTFLAGLNPDCELAIKSVLAIGQGPNVFYIPQSLENPFELLRQLLQHLLQVEKFYDSLGGIVGYHSTTLQLIEEAKHPVESAATETTKYYHPQGFDVSHDSQEVRESIYEGIASLPSMSEIYPLGGAGDRLGLIDENSGKPLPAAKLPFLGRSLLTGLIRDLQAREYLHYKLFNKQVVTPIAMMTSHEKNNHAHILNLLEENHWFHRPKTLYNLFSQPSVPVVTIEGNWAMKAPLKLFLKPGGHGAIWKLAKDSGVFNWLESHNRHKALIRQINNPMAGIDHGLLAFTGLGCKKNHSFGFASCHRTVGTSEGVNVVKEEKTNKGYSYTISNVEYTDFDKHSIEDTPSTPGSTHSRFPSNTNILFADLKTVSQTASKHPIPGMLINMKGYAPSRQKNGCYQKVRAGRLESTMQNLADFITDEYPFPLDRKNCKTKKTFLTYNERRKTISVTKRSYTANGTIEESPIGCYLTLLNNYADLLQNYCGMDVPELDSQLPNTLPEGFVCSIHPALGPLFSVIEQKIRYGFLAAGSELQLEIAELDMQNIHLDGSLLIQSDAVTGHIDDNSYLTNSEQTGKCTLHNVQINNAGVDWSAKNIFWKNDIRRHESLEIILRGNAEFYAENVCFNGNQTFEVRNNERMVIYEKDKQLVCEREKIDEPTWYWEYNYQEDGHIALSTKSALSPV